MTIPQSLKDTLLLCVLVPFHEQDGVLYQERQACNGLRLWAENFDALHVMAVLEPGSPPGNWIPVDEIGPARARMEFHTFPRAYRPDQFLRHLPAQRRRIRALIDQATHLNFATGGTWGDWGVVGVLEAHKMGRKSSMWTDQISSSVMWRTRKSANYLRRLLTIASYLPMVWTEREVARRADLGLFHGNDTYARYSPHSPQPELVHNIHLNRDQHISPDRLAQKLKDVTTGPLRIAYLGRAVQLKGPMDWLDTLEILHRNGVDFTATWLGEGPELAKMQARIAQGPLNAHVQLPGFTSNRAVMFETLRSAHIHMFCHKTPESPRNLIEALVSACPIVGYASAYSQDLILGHGGGVLTPLNDPAALADAILHLAHHRTQLRDLIEKAAKDGAPYDEDKVFRHRAELIKRYA